VINFNLNLNRYRIFLTSMLNLRPHHLIDIIRNIGQNRPVVAHPYGHAQHTITKAIIDGTEQEIRFVVDADDLCKPCIHLTSEGICKDVLPQLERKVWKQQYNDELDHRVLEHLGLQEGVVVTLNEFLKLIESKLTGLIPVCTHPKEDEGSRRQGIEKGIEKLRGGDGVSGR
jgi:hypothetical protein